MAKNEASTNGQLKVVPLSKIRENPVALRGVDKANKDYASLVESIKLKGVLNPILLREYGKDEETGELVYAVTDGLQRYSASIDAGKKDIPAYIRNMGDGDVWEAQIIANAVKVETHPHEFAKQIYRIFTANPLLTASELSARLGKGPEWISKMLGLIRIKDDRIASLINEGKITLSNAYALSKLPEEEHTNWIDRAMTQSPADFVPAADARVKEIKDAKRQGKAPPAEGFNPVPTLRKMAQLKAERDNPKTGLALIKELNITTPDDAFRLAIDWVLQMDPKSIEVRKQQEEERKRLKKEADQKKKQERDEQKRKEAARVMSELEESSK